MDEVSKYDKTLSKEDDPAVIGELLSQYANDLFGAPRSTAASLIQNQHQSPNEIQNSDNCLPPVGKARSAFKLDLPAHSYKYDNGSSSADESKFDFNHALRNSYKYDDSMLGGGKSEYDRLLSPFKYNTSQRETAKSLGALLNSEISGNPRK